MKIYRTRNDVVLIRICGEFLLVATRSARHICPDTQHINKTAALLWTMLENGASLDDLIQTIMLRCRVSDHTSADIKSDITELLHSLDEKGYLITITSER